MQWCSRAALRRADAHVALLGERGALSGHVVYVPAFSQFDERWTPLVRRYGAPRAICGYASVSLALLLARMLANASTMLLDAETLATLLFVVRDGDTVAPVLEQQMSALRRRRWAYIGAHSDDGAFASRRACDEYASAWVANFEISDALREASAEAPDTLRCVSFVRFNQFPELHAATHEERERIAAEETRFGGRADKMAGTVAYGPHDSVFLVEQFAPERVLRSAAEHWASARSTPSAAAPRVAVVDCNGHFVAVLACRLRDASALGRSAPLDGDGERGERVLLVFDTQRGASLDALGMAPVWTFDSLFAGSESDDGDSAARRSAPDVRHE